MTIETYLDLVETYLKTLPELAGIGIVVEKQQDVDAEKEQYLAKSKGYAILVGEVRNNNPDKDADGPRVKLRFGVTIYTPKIVTGNKKTGGELRSTILKELHGETLEDDQHCYAEAKYVEGRPFIETKKGKRDRMVHAMAFEAAVDYADD